MTHDTMSVSFNKNACDNNPYCPVVRACPSGAMYIDRKTFRPSFDADKCTDCGACLSSCPHSAMTEK